MCGEIYQINGRKIFTMGGVLSIDKEWRTPDKSWWTKEVINQNDMENAWKNLAKYENSVDIVITHTCPYHCVSEIVGFNSPKLLDEATLHLETIYSKINSKSGISDIFMMI